MVTLALYRSMLNINMALAFIIFIVKFFFFSFLLLLPFLYDLNARFRYYFKFYVYYSLFAIFNLILAPIAAWTWNPMCGSNQLILSFLNRTIGHILNIRWTVIGRENLKNNQLIVIVANQQGPIDILGAFSAIASTRKTFIIQKQSFNHNFDIFAGLYSIFNSIFTCTGNDCNSVVHSTITKEFAHKNVPACIWIFFADIQNVEIEIFHSALKKHVPIVPVVLSNYYFLNVDDKIFDPGHVIVKILPSIQNDADSIQDITDVIAKMKSTMKNEHKKLSDEIRPPTLQELRECYEF